jgi:hypothetical protein
MFFVFFIKAAGTQRSLGRRLFIYRHLDERQDPASFTKLQLSQHRLNIRDFKLTSSFHIQLRDHTIFDQHRIPL